MKILIDSNIIVEDYNLRKGDTILFLRNFRKSGYSCYISEVTYNEIIINFKRQLNDKIEAYNSSLNKMNRQINSGLVELNEAFFNDKANEYEQQLESKLKEYKIERLPVIEIPHSKILNRIFLKKRPFDNKDNGYKDYLIFETALALAKNTNLIILTRDNDFGEKELHSDLKELVNDQSTIILRKSFKELNSKELKESIQNYNAKLQFVKEIFEDDAHKESYMKSVIEFLVNESLEVYPYFIYNNIDVVDNPVLDSYHFFSDTAKMKSVSPITDNIVRVKFELKSYLSYMFTIDMSKNYQLQNFPNDIQISKVHEEYQTFITLGYWYTLEISVQTDMNGENIQFWELKVIN